jgi:hypothetical protein
MSPMTGAPFIAAAIADDGDSDGGGPGGGGPGGGGPGGGPGGSDGGPTYGSSAGAGGGGKKCKCKFLVFNCSCKSASRPQKRTAKAQGGPGSAAEARAREIIIAGLTSEQSVELNQRGFQTVAQTESALLQTTISRVRIPAALSERRALSQIQAVAPGVIAARNDLYARNRLASYRPSGEPCGRKCQHFELTAWNASAGRCSANVRIGVIDTGVDVDHPSLAGAGIETRVTRSSDRKAANTEHGTGVVSLLVGRDGSSVVGLASAAKLLAADAFHVSGSDAAADAFDLVASLDWLAAEKVNIINLSLSGPDNPVLRKAVEATAARGIVLVAAAGLPDARSTQGYPARYEPVIAVSAVDGRMRPSRLSARGEHVDFAAPGVGLLVATAGGKLRKVDGTSFAAPFVTAAFANAIGARRAVADVTGLLQVTAIDLGEPGHDPVYGWGVVQFGALPSC